MRVPPEVTTSALTDPHQWLVLIAFGLAWLVLSGLAISVGLLLAAWRGAFRFLRPPPLESRAVHRPGGAAPIVRHRGPFHTGPPGPGV